jgi:hypothetical protein
MEVAEETSSDQNLECCKIKIKSCTPNSKCKYENKEEDDGSHRYQTLDNGGVAFEVVKTLTPRGLCVEITNDWEEQYEFDEDFKPFYMKIDNLENIIDGSESEFGTPGAALLLETKNKNEYIFIGTWIGKFESKSKIIALYNTEKGSEVCFPWAIDSENNIYLLFSSTGRVFKASNDLASKFTKLSDKSVSCLNLTTKEVEEEKIPIADPYIETRNYSNDKFDNITVEIFFK